MLVLALVITGHFHDSGAASGVMFILSMRPNAPCCGESLKIMGGVIKINVEELHRKFIVC